MKRTSTWLLPAALLLAGCPSPAPMEDAGDNDASMMDATMGMDVVRDTGVRTDSAPACPTGQSTCSGRCVDTRSDRANCGACGMACAAGLVCTNGTCATNCATGQVDCSGRCIDTATDNSNCGACGTVCAAGQVCSMGRCALTCAAGLLTCTSGASAADGGDASDEGSGERYCANGASDNRNCGACGTVCAPGTACNAGRCEVSCGAGQTLCAGACRDLQSDNSNCGACGTVCAAGQVCSMGACAATCGAGTTNCSGDCVRTTSDPNHCGGCGRACALANVSVQACAGSSCAVGACAAGFGDCDLNAANGCEANVRGADVNNCGGCGIRCSFANAAASCGMGACVMGACNPGFADCDGNPANGCEANVRGDNSNCGACGAVCAAGQVCSMGACAATCGTGTTNCSGDCVRTTTDPNHCGGCGRVCALANVSVQACASSSCVVGECNAGFGNCDGNPANGCETNVRSADVNNCGGCGIRCSFANAAASCGMGACVMGACNPGFADCDGNPANGCEVNVSSDNSNCGGCGTTCAVSEVCAAGGCGATCSPGTTACSGDCVRTASDPNHCGACGRACALANVSVQACASSSCVVGACSAGFGDCDTSAANGCETNVRGADVNNCGACNVRCSFANAAASCAMGACVMGACNAGFADCDGNPANGCEVNLNADGANCGACGAVCGAGRMCAAGVCASSCGMGQSNCSGACVNTTTDPSNCGACGTSCPAVTNGTSVCAASACRFVCDGTFADCDRAAANGCEVNTANSISNCGACGRACAAGANQSATCAAGVCGTVCAPGFADCDGNVTNGCEVNTNASLTNCGACGVTCTAAQTCFAGACRAYATTGLSAMPMGTFRNACTTMGNTVLVTTGDDVVTLGPIGFPFAFYGTTFTQFQADTNGNVLLGSTGSSTLTNTCALSGATKTNILAVLWDDMNLGRSGAVGQHRICSVTTGAAPSRELLITYEEVPYYAAATPVTTHATYSVIVRESDGAITYQYLLNALNASATVGIRGNTAAQTTVPMTPACNTVATLDGQQLSFTLTP